MASAAIDVDTLTDGGQRAEAVAATIAGWLAQAQRTLDVALYNVRVPGAPGDRLAAALRDASARGVAVRALVQKPGVEPLPYHGIPQPRTRMDVLVKLRVQVQTVDTGRDLMHHKFAVRDGEAVLTGSANWTLDDFTTSENVILRLADPGLAASYATVFEELWDGGTVLDTGDADHPAVRVGDATVRPWFCPGRGRELSHRIADRIGAARSRVRIASPVITAGPILAALRDAEASRRADVSGIVDMTQTLNVLRQWRMNRHSWKPPALEGALTGLAFSGKHSAPFDGQPDSRCDWMHAKIVVADDAVFAGSFNLSRSGEDNAENVLEIEDTALAARMAAWVDELRARYPAAAPVLAAEAAV